MTRLFYILFVGLTACVAAPEVTVPESIASWKLESLAGLDNLLRKTYETKSYFWPGHVEIPVKFEDLDYAEFSKASGSLRVISQTRDNVDHMVIAFSSCNANFADYVRDGVVWRHLTTSHTAKACFSNATDSSGKQVALMTPMFVDQHFTALAPDITNYEVSSDGQILTLLGADNQALGVFRLEEATQ